MQNSPVQSNKVSFEIAILITIMISGALLIIAGSSKYGTGLTGDSISYVALADNILTDFSFNDISGEPFVLWPPGYSITLAFVKLVTSADIYDLLLPYNLFFYCFLLLSLWAILKKRIGSDYLRLAFLAVLGLSPALIRIYIYAFSEVPFLPLMVLFFLLIDRIETGKKFRTVLSASAVVMALSVIKYTGILLLPVLIWAILKNFEGLKKVCGVLLSVTIVPLPLFVVLISNYIRAGTFMGYRGASAINSGEVLYDLGATLVYWVFPVIIMGVFAVVLTARAGVKLDFFLEKYLWAFTIVYLVANFLMATIQAVDDLNNRLLVPVFVTLFIPLARFAERALSSGFVKWRRVAIVLLLCLIPLSYIRTNIRATTARVTFGAGGIASDEYHGKFPSDIARIKSLTIKKSVFSNNPAVFYYLTGLHNKILPRKKYYNSNETEVSKEELIQYFERSSESLIVLLKDFEAENLYSIQEISRFRKLSKIDQGNGWTVFRLGDVIAKGGL